MKTNKFMVSDILNGKTEVELSTNQIIKSKFDFYSALIKSYITHLHEVENKNKKEVLEVINPMISELVEEFSFGNQFVKGIHGFIDTKFYKTKHVVHKEIKEMANLDDQTFHMMMDRVKESPLRDKFSPLFKLHI